MNISILTSSKNHPVVPLLYKWKDQLDEEGHSVSIEFSKKEIKTGDVLFLISCGEILNESDRGGFSSVYVIHASDLPLDRGWSPHIWNILKGNDRITVTLLEAGNSVDSGRIIKKMEFKLDGYELLDEINNKLFEKELDLMSYVITNYNRIRPYPQIGEVGQYLPRRHANDSQLDINKSINDQFNLLRVVDNERYPAFFEMDGHRYILKIEKAGYEK